MWIGFWDAEESLDRFIEAGSPIVENFRDGLHVRLQPLRGHGQWPGFPDDLTPEGRDDEGPVVVMTLGLLRLRRSISWNRASNNVQKQFLQTPGVVWAMGASKPPFFAATVSIWESANAATTFARLEGQAHAKAARDNAKDPFMSQEIFARFKPVSSSGSLMKNPPLAGDWLLASRS